MAIRDLEPPFAPSDAAQGRVDPRLGAPERLRTIVDLHYDFLWRTLRYAGVPDEGIDDAAQQALCVLARRLNRVAIGAEQAFLFSTAMRVASEAKRSARRRRASPNDEDIEALAATGPAPDELLDQRRAHEVLRQVLERLPLDLRMVFVLFELEELKIAEIAEMLELPVGTVSSRLRRAREKFQSVVRSRSVAAAHRSRGGGG